MSDALKQIWEKVDQMIGPQRMETEAEHIARDMREGRFPKRSDPIQVPVAGPAAARHLAPGDDLVGRLETKAAMIALGERIAWGSDSAIMQEAAARIAALTATVAELRAEAAATDDLMGADDGRIAVLEAENATLRDRLARMGKTYWLLRSFATHDDSCKLNKPPKFEGPCSCGLANALTEGESIAALTDGGSNG